MTSWEAKISNLKKLKGRPLEEKLSYIVTYFKLPIAVTLVALFFAGSMIYYGMTQKGMALSLCCVNSYAAPGAVEKYLEDFAKVAAIDLSKNEVYALERVKISSVDAVTSYQSEQLIMVQIAAEALDLMAADQNIVAQYAYQETYLDLSKLLTSEQLQMFSGYLLYMDMELVETISNLSFGDAIPQLPDPAKPEQMGKPVPIAVRIPEESAFAKLCYPYGGAAIAVVANTQNTENAATFLISIFE